MASAKSPKVSVIIPCYNSGKYIAEAVDSVLAQTFQDFEIIITDDASNDGTTPATIKAEAKKDKRIKICTHKENQGLPAARNTAIKAARGRYILPLDADDKLTPTMLKKFTDVMEKGNADVVYCHALSFGDKSRGIIRQATNPHIEMMRKTCVPVASLYKKSDWEEFGGYDESFREGYEDWDFWLNFVAAKKNFVLIDEALFHYRMTSATSLSDGLWRKHHVVKKIYKKYPSIFSWKDPRFIRAFLSREIRRLRRYVIRIRLNRNEQMIFILGIYILNRRS